MSVVKIVVVALDSAERLIIKEAVERFANSVDFSDETDETIKAFKSVVSDILRKVK